MSEGCSPNECPVGKRLERQLEEFRKHNTETHEKLWAEINLLKTNDAVQDSKYDTILNQLNAVVIEVKALQAVPGDNWKNLVKTVMTVLVSALLGFLAAQLGLG